MTHEMYDFMLQQQSGRCAICDRPPAPGAKKRLAVDHNHQTATVRGLLCLDCNTGIGKFSENQDRMRAAIEYLERFSKGPWTPPT
jgi:hypothetical protein